MVFDTGSDGVVKGKWEITDEKVERMKIQKKAELEAIGKLQASLIRQVDYLSRLEKELQEKV